MQHDEHAERPTLGIYRRVFNYIHIVNLVVLSTVYGTVACNKYKTVEYKEIERAYSNFTVHCTLV